MVITLRDAAIELHEQGSGPPLLLLHAGGHDHHDFDAVAPALAQRFRVIAVDWPGAHGSASMIADPARTSAALYADLLEQLVDALALPPAVILGSSVGGYAAACLALRSPERVRGLILVDSAGFTKVGVAARLFCALKGRRWVTAAIEGRFARHHLRLRTPTVLERLRRIDAARRDPAWLASTAALWRSFADPEMDLRERATAIAAPTLLVWGARDPVIPSAAGQAAERIIPGATRVELPTGHLPFAEAPEAFLEALDPFLGRLGDAQAA